MQSAEKFDVSTLTWIKGEIDETLKQARIALEAFVEDTADESQLGFCVTYLHQVRGTLQMVELFGAATYATEMEQLSRALQENSVSNRDEGFEVLMRAILQLPDYLEGLQSGQADNPIALLPLMNEMRGLRGEKELATSDFFRPDLTIMPPGAPSAGTVDIRLLVGKLRPFVQASLLHLKKRQNVAKALQNLGGAVDKLSKVATTNSLRQYLWVLGALIEAISDDGVTLNEASWAMLARLEQVAKLIEAKGENALKTDVAANLVRALLLEIAQASSSGSKVAEIKRSFALDSMVGGGGGEQTLGGFNAELKRAVSADIMAELSKVKDSFDIFVRSDRSEPSTLNPLADSLMTMADTLGMIREEKLRDRIRGQVQTLRDLASGTAEANDENLMGVAGAILSVESALRDWGSLAPVEKADHEEGAEGAVVEPEAEAEHRRIVSLVMKEARDDLIKIREAISNFLANPGDKAIVQHVPEWLQGIIGSLVMLSYKRVAQVLRAANLYINSAILHSDKVPPEKDLDALADVVMSVEYYLEAFVESRVHPASVLEVAEQALHKLGFAVDQLAAVSAAPAAEATPVGGIELVEEEAPAEEFEVVEVEPTETIEYIEEIAPAAVEAEEEVIEAIEPPSVEEHELLVAEEPQEIEFVEEETAVAEEVAEAPSTPAARPDTEVDEEILEIFIEEAGEELENIANYLPRWINNQSDEDTLRDLRRSFHTLKGSGRLVGALKVGEFAWAYENLLNRVIDGTVKPGQAMFDMLQQSAETLPELIEEFKSGKTPTADYLSLQEMANEMANPGTAKAAAPAKPVETPKPAEALPEIGGTLVIPDIDPTLLEIYSSEAESHLDAVDSFVHEFHDAARRKVDEPLIRALHTLTGSSRMAGVTGVAEISGTFERYAKSMQANNLPLNDDAVGVLAEIVKFIQDLIAHLTDRSKPIPDNTTLVDKVRTLYEAVQHLDEEGASPEHGLAVVSEEPEVEIAAEAEVEELLPEAEEELTLEQLTALYETPPEETLTEETAEAAVTTGAETIELEGEPTAEIEVEEISLGELEAIGEEAVAEEAIELAPVAEEEELVEFAPIAEEEEVIELTPVAEEPPAAAVEAAIERAEEGVEIGGEKFYPRVSELPDYDPELVDIFLDEGREIIDQSEITLQAWADDPDDASKVKELERQLHTLKGGARMAGITAIGDLSHSLESTFEAIVDGIFPRSRDMINLFQLAHDRLVEMLEQVGNDEPVRSGEDLINRIHEMGTAGQAEVGQAPAIEEIEVSEPEVAALPEEVEAAAIEEVTLPVEAEAAEEAEALEGLTHGAIDISQDAVAKLLDKGPDYLADIRTNFALWESDRDNEEPYTKMQRSLHLLRLDSHSSAIEPVSDVIDRISTLFNRVRSGKLEWQDPMAALTDKAISNLGESFAAIATGALPDEPRQLIRELDNAIAGQLATVASAVAEPVPEVPAEVAPATEITFEEAPVVEPVVVEAQAEEKIAEPLKTAEPTATEAEVEGDGRERRTHDRQPQDLTRVRADLLDQMVNFAGEISIYRSRIGQELGTYNSTLEEITQTIERLREQLRKFDIETEATIQSRYEEAGSGYEDFDPLEFDRFTTMQQLSRSMMESLSDLVSLEDILRGVTREAETLLIQQARVNTELQESLVRTRMVPLVENAPRLRRIVRQVASELNKKAVLRFQGAEVEMDRTVVERMLAPIEHVLRNAIAHGIEMPEQRLSAGKPDEGTITIAQSKEGSEVVIRIFDDGAGLDIAAIRAKAIERGMMNPKSKLTDQEVARFILEAGFSTASSVSQIAGRGVGMDVVASEVKQLGGVLDIETRQGAGTTFTARLPLTLAVSRALLVYSAEDTFAIPLLSIESIERLDHERMAELLANERPVYRWLGHDYDLISLNSILHGTQTNLTTEGKQPILLAQTGGHRLALIVDGLIGSREIVVKSLGRQLSSLQELSGATILADGSVALILDLPAIIRKGIALRTGGEEELLEEIEQQTKHEPLVMVVDDSITVRKVTERLLARNNFKSVTAKDGVDALAVLEDVMPDVMLLDIEMPRMDGYELATHIRNSDRLRDLPIIMITSRTGEKHRQRAMDIGVNVYMGKPYTETDLLANIKNLLGIEDD